MGYPDRPGRLTLAVLLLAGGGFAPLLARATPGTDAAGWLDDPIRLTPAQQSSLERGEPVVRVLDPSASHEVALAGAIRVEAPASVVTDLAADERRWKAPPALLQMGRFSQVPVVEDVAALELQEPDLAALRRCARRPCDVKLAALAPEAFRQFDWRKPNPRQRAEAIVRDALVQHVRDYLTRGDAALMVFGERDTDLGDEIHGLLNASPYLERQAPAVLRYLATFPDAPPPQIESFVYWARETFGFKPVLSLYHVVIWRPRGHAVIVSKQFFGSRYFDASLDVLAIGADLARPDACYVVHVARSRTDSLRGLLGWMKRPAVVDEAEESLARLLVRLKRLAEHGDSASADDGRQARERERS